LPQFHDDADACVDAIIATVGKKIVLGLPLGVGKANHLANALYARAAADPTIDLHIFTALTLEKKLVGPKLLHRFADPITERLFGDYPDLAYARALRTGTLPKNIVVSEFYLLAGQWLASPLSQQGYVSANYTEVPALLLDLGINVVGQLVARRDGPSGPEFSLSCNPDVTLDVLPELLRRRAAGKPFVMVGEVNDELPFMTGEAVLPASAFDHVLDAPKLRYSLFAPPKEAVGLPRHAIGLRIAGLIRDAGTLQIGIGALADALVWALILRHKRNDAFRDIARRIGVEGDLAPFETGLYGVSEMFVDVFLDLYREGILQRRAKDGALLHGGFFLGPKGFYRALRDMPEAERAAFKMTAISFTNGLTGPDEAERRAQRQHARFVNDGMMATLLGEIASDTRDDGLVVSGVGGQYNFVAQAHSLEGARSVIAIGGTRTSKGKVTSNIRLNVGHATIPRHLRDIVVTEYGVADLRGKSDRDCIVAMLAVADSRFQPELLRAAKASRKIEADYAIPERFRRNTPKALEEALRPALAQGLLPDYPFGTDLDPLEQKLAKVLENLKSAPGGKLALARRFIASLFMGSSPDADAALERLGLQSSSSLEDRAAARLIRAELRRLEAEGRSLGRT
jgi:acyl-CoA hydrolase